MSYVLVCHGDALGGHLEHLGKYLASYDLEVRDGAVRWTRHLDEALHFPDLETAMRTWQTPSKTVPVRPDGRPNKPLTAWTVEPRWIPEKGTT